MNEQQHGMTGAWALDALDDEERAQVERWLAADPEAAAEARSFEETAGELAGSLAPLQPPPALKAAVMGRIATTRQLSPLAEEEDGNAEPPEPATAPATNDSGDPRAQLVPLERYRASVRRSRWLSVAAALLMVTTLAGVGLWTTERDAQQEARASLQALQSEQAAAEESAAMVTGILSAEDAAHLTVPSRDGGALQVVYSRDQQAMMVQAAGLPELPADRTYQLWTIEDGTATSAGLLASADDAVLTDGPIGEAVVLGLTIEPAGGSAQPSMDPIASEEL